MGYKFDRKKHIHTLDEKPLMGVTSVLKMWGDPNPLMNWAVRTAVDAVVSGETPEDAKKAHLKKRDKAGNKGTEVHAELENMVNDMIDGQLDGTYSDIAMKVHDWLVAEQIQPVASEMNVWSRKHWYGGIADGVILKDNKKYILDFKTSGTVQTKFFYQLGAYSIAVQEMKPEAEVHGAVIVHIPRGKSFNPEKNIYWRYDIKELEQAFLNILNTCKTDREVAKLIAY